MTHAAATCKYATERFWKGYLKRLAKQGVKEKFRGGYVIRAKQYIKTYSDRRLADHTAEDVTGYLESDRSQIGRIGRLKDWQFLQVVDAIQNLFLIAGIDLVNVVDWSYWRDSARSFHQIILQSQEMSLYQLRQR